MRSHPRSRCLLQRIWPRIGITIRSPRWNNAVVAVVHVRAEAGIRLAMAVVAEAEAAEAELPVGIAVRVRPAAGRSHLPNRCRPTRSSTSTR